MKHLSRSGLLTLLLLLSVFDISCSFFINFSHGINGGVTCSACTLILGVLGQVAEVNNSTLVEAARKICVNLPKPFRPSCRKAVDDVESVFRDIYISDVFTPDVVCYGLSYCHIDPEKQFCHLFPSPDNFHEAVDLVKSVSGNAVGPNPCRLPGVRNLCSFLVETFHRMKPAWDLDGDMFSNVKPARGSDWRGRDCRDWDSNVYPGRKPERADVDVDADCNGIWGLDEETGVPWETELCKPNELGARGVIFIGDSIGAHFHFPEVWMNPLLVSKVLAHNFTGALLNELDWPQYGFATGFENTSSPLLSDLGYTKSLYLRLRERNLCNHRDYQNICRNGGNSHRLISYVDNVARNQNDKPALVFIGIFGNDVCNRFPDTVSHMTSPDVFYTNVKTALDKLARRLPFGSHVILLGLADGGFIFPTMSERIHPIGKLHGNVRYRDEYKWLECMETSPCVGWMSEGVVTRQATTQAARTLSLVLENIARTAKYGNITLHYIPDPLSRAIEYWKSTGSPLWGIVEAVDGLHPNQVAQQYISKAIWRALLRAAPEAVGHDNPHNKQILEQFGDQGGH